VPAILGRAGRRVGSVLLLFASLFGLAASAPAENDRSDPLCPHIVACQYEAPAFTIRVVDQQTGQPLADVHAIAAWLVYGFHGRQGVLMALEAVSGPDGQLSFPAWGPVRSGVEGLVGGRDPLVSLFRPGYRTQLLLNATPIERSDTARVHAFEKAGSTVKLVSFHGSPAETVSELRTAATPLEGTTLSQDDPLPFRRAYANRLRRVKIEAERSDHRSGDLDSLLWRLSTGIIFLDPGGVR
jgi:hypothetical protein